MTPSDLESHRQSHHIRAPCCLCAFEDSGSSYTETTVMVATCGRLSGEYVAACAKDRCGYLGNFCRSPAFVQSLDFS